MPVQLPARSIRRTPHIDALLNALPAGSAERLAIEKQLAEMSPIALRAAELLLAASPFVPSTIPSVSRAYKVGSAATGGKCAEAHPRNQFSQ